MKFIPYTIKHGDTLWTVVGERWETVYHMSINKPFREKFQDPNKIESNSIIYIPCHGKLPQPKTNSIAHFSMDFPIGDDICVIPIIKYFYKIGYRIHLYCSEKLKPIFRFPFVEKMMSHDDIRKYYSDGDVIVVPNGHGYPINEDEYFYSGCYIISRMYRSTVQTISDFYNNFESAPRWFFRMIGIDPALHDDFEIDFPYDEQETEHYDVIISEGSYADPWRRLHSKSVLAIYNWYKDRGKNVVIIPYSIYRHFDAPCINFDFNDNEQFMKCINIIKNCKLLITTNSGLMHIRARFKKPMVVFSEKQVGHLHGWVEPYDGAVHVDGECFMEKYFDEQEMQSKINGILSS